jgi:hypothetical protein
MWATLRLRQLQGLPKCSRRKFFLYFFSLFILLGAAVCLDGLLGLQFYPKAGSRAAAGFLQASSGRLRSLGTEDETNEADGHRIKKEQWIQD